MGYWEGPGPPSFGSDVGPSNWHNLYFFTVVPVPDDPRWLVAQHFSALVARSLPAGTVPDPIMFEGYLAGRMTAAVLRGIGRPGPSRGRSRRSGTGWGSS